ncbi:MAG: hypothetical protein WCB85_04220 [Candidatus Dormiibacterota bacterium]
MSVGGRAGILLTGALLMLAGCGPAQPTASGPIPACSLLDSSDIDAAVHLQPSTEGGGVSGSGSTCVWALPNAANGSISLIQINCGATCTTSFASLAPSPAFSGAGDAAGAGVSARLSASSITAEQDGRVIQITVENIGVSARPALITLARRALQHLR